MVWLAPFWLAALAALAIPVFLHLRRQRLGRRIQVGSVRHLSGAALPRRRRLRIRDPWLLALRLAILTALVLALAGPALTRRLQPQHWAVLSPELAGSSGAAPVIDSLRRAGAEIRLLAPGFPKVGSRGATGARTEARAGGALDFWSLLAAADAELPAGSNLVAVVPAKLALLRGNRPGLASAVTIRAVPGDAGDTAVVEAVWRRGESVSRLIARADDGGTARSTVTRPVRAADSAVMTADSLPVRVVADSARQDDARFVRAAIGAAAATLGVRVALTTESADSAPSADSRPGASTMWLSTAPPPSWSGVTLADASDPVRRIDDVSRTDPRADAYGRPILARAGGGEAQVFAGRFSPRHGDFVLGAEFPQLIARLWAGAALGVPASLARDLRAVAPAQLAPARGHGRPTTAGSYPLRKLLLALSALLFLCERWLAYRRR